MKLPWYLRQRTSIALVAGLGGLFTLVGGGMAQQWAGNSSRLWWGAVATSADGRTLVAAANRHGYFVPTPAPIFVSTNAGSSWMQTTAPTNGWASVACSADGVRLVAVRGFGWVDAPTTGRGFIYTSPDTGSTWTPAIAPTNNWTSIASSTDGARLFAAASPQWDQTASNYLGQGVIYCSSDAGASWTQTTAPRNAWHSIACSADGLRLVASAAFSSGDPGDGLIYTSPDSGATWAPSKAPTNNWTSVASSADGSKLVAVAAPFWDPTSSNYVLHGAIFCSYDAGTTWTQTSAPNNNYWSGVSSSADGTKLAAVSYDVGIYRSSDAGATWTAMSESSYEIGRLGAIACSADGYRLVACGDNSPIDTWPYSGPWRVASTPSNSWQSVVCSSDGIKLAAADPGFIYDSGNSGLDWTQTTAPPEYWSCLASSARGDRLVAVSASYGYPAYKWGVMYFSSNAGVTWAQTGALSNNWTSISSSADGTKLVASARPFFPGDGTQQLGEAGIFISSDSGVSWKLTSAPSNWWTSVASSTDGAKLIAVGEDAGYRSPDAGATWARISLPSGYWNSVASSADGIRLVAAAGAIWDSAASNYIGGAIYHSIDAGVTWIRTSAPTGYWTAVASSADGILLCALQEGELQISTDSGATWAQTNIPAGWWNSVAVSANGSYLIVAGDGQIATLRSPVFVPPAPPSPQLAINPFSGKLGLSWLVTSTPFVLQQSSDLLFADWVPVLSTPTLNFTNLHYQLTLPPATANTFYRLKLK